MSCEVETEDEIEITCHSNPLGWSSISYSINDGHLTELDCKYHHTPCIQSQFFHLYYSEVALYFKPDVP